MFATGILHNLSREGILLEITDNFLLHARQARNYADAASYSSITLDSTTYHNVAPAPVWPEILVRYGNPTLTFFRRSDGKSDEATWIHNDIDMGSYTGILYLNFPTEIHEGAGTSFWRPEKKLLFPVDWTKEGQSPDDWTLEHRVPMQWNRFILFDSMLFHSRALRHHWHRRLVQVFFFGLLRNAEELH